MIFHFRLLFLPGAFCLLSLPQLKAQPVEVFGGYTLGKMNPEETSNRATMSGWNASITGYPTSRFGITADFAGYYGTGHPATAGDGSGFTAVSVRQYSFMAGPQLRLVRRKTVETSIRALAGGARGYVPESSTLDQTTFAALVGSNFDVNVSGKVALRFSPGVYVTRFGGETQMNFRFSIGPVFRFGGRG